MPSTCSVKKLSFIYIAKEKLSKFVVTIFQRCRCIFSLGA